MPIVAPALGFVGVRRGLSCAQFHTVCRILVARRGRGAVAAMRAGHYSPDGDAGADFARITRWMRTPPQLTVHECGESPAMPVLSAESLISWADFSIEPDAVPMWNRAIVDHSDALLACPPIVDEDPRSRTWAAVRYARKVGKTIVVVYPDGSLVAGGREHFLVMDGTGEGAVSVFLGRDPRTDGHTVAVRPAVLEELPIQGRKGGAARPVLGRCRHDPHRYREFPSQRSLLKAGFAPVGPYRVCETWDDYHFPWTTAPDAGSALSAVETDAERNPLKTDAEMPSPLDAMNPSLPTDAFPSFT
jgi:hypothetical protein